MANEDISSREIFKLVNDTRLELSGHILRLEGKFDTLEAGRVSAVEKAVATLTAEQEPVRRLVYGLVALVMIAVVGAIIALVVTTK